MYIYMGHMGYAQTKPYPDSFWADNRIELIRGWVSLVEASTRTLRFEGGRTLRYDQLLIATGSRPNRFDWPGQELQRVSGMYSLQDLARLEAASPSLRRGAVVGGGLIGVELAEMMHSRGIGVTMLVRESSYWNGGLPAEESRIVTEVIREQGIDLRLSTELVQIEADDHGRACAVLDSTGSRTEVGFVGLCAGVSPNVAFLEGSGIEVGRGVRVDCQLRSSTAHVFAAGDCAEVVRSTDQAGQVVAVWYTGRKMGETVAANILGQEQRYEPGVWFNSAKFFDLEYQVYGEVPAETAGVEPDTAPSSSLFWMADDRRHSVRIVHRNGRVVGFSLLGIRYRHRVCERWIEEQRSIDEVLAQLKDAHFDPELQRGWDREIIRALGAQA